jgi:hypothetical protein
MDYPNHPVVDGSVAARESRMIRIEGCRPIPACVRLD